MKKIAVMATRSAAPRTVMSRKLRFQVFKRDSFTCQYCGATPPGSVLHVDHINPVCRGGKNNIDNLITSCEACNLGKSGNPLSDIPKSLKDKAFEIREREAQIRGYNSVFEKRVIRIESEAWKVAAVLQGVDVAEEFDRIDFVSIKRFLERLPLDQVIRSAEKSVSKIGLGKSRSEHSNRFKYFCGVCWRKIREAEGGES